MVFTDLHYFGSLSYYRSIVKTDIVVFDIVAPFSKMSFKNRMVIATAQGPLHLTIPIVGGRDQKKPMNEILIANDTPWQKQHFKSIYTNYKRAPYFEYYVDSLGTLYKENYVLLTDHLLASQNWVKQQLKAQWQIEAIGATKYEPNEPKWIDPYKPNNFQTQVNPLSYQQVFQTDINFIPNLCILDLLFATGGKQTLKML